MFSYPYKGHSKQPLIVYSEPLRKYIAFFGGMTTWCTDLEKQDWAPLHEFNTNWKFTYNPNMSWFDRETHDQFRVRERGLGITTSGQLYDLKLTAVEPYEAEIIQDVYPPEETNEPLRPYDPTARPYHGYPETVLTGDIRQLKDFKVIGLDQRHGHCVGGNNTIYHPRDPANPGSNLSGLVEIDKPGAYRVLTSGYTGPSMGIWRLSLGGQPQGKDMDLYALPLKASGLAAKLNRGYRRHDQGYLEIADAPRQLAARWEHLGKGALSKGHVGQFDRLMFVSVNDNFDASDLHPQWCLTGQADPGVREGYLRLTGNGNMLQTPRKGVFPWNEWDIVTKVEFEPEEAGPGAGLIAQGDGGKLLTLGRAFRPGAGRGIEIALDTRGEGQKDEFFVVEKEAAPYLRISKRGLNYTCWWSRDLREWTQGPTFEAPALGTAFPRVGLFRSGEGPAADFDWFDLARLGDNRIGNPFENPAPRKYQVEHIEGKRLKVSSGCRIARTRDDRATSGYYDRIEFDRSGAFVEYTIRLSSWNGIKGPTAQSDRFQGPGRYRVELGCVSGPEYGRVKLSVNGRDLAKLDFSGVETAFDELNAGEMDFVKDGPQTFRFSAPEGGGGKLKPVAIDYLELVPVNRPWTFLSRAGVSGDSIVVKTGKPLELKFDLSALPPQTEIAEAVLKLDLANDCERGAVLRAVPNGGSETAVPFRFVAAGKAGEVVAVALTRLVGAWIRGDRPNGGLTIQLDAEDAPPIALGNAPGTRPRLEIRAAVMLQAESAQLDGGAEISDYSGKRGPVKKDDDTVPDWALEVLKRGQLLYGGESAVLNKAGASMKFPGLPGASKIRLRYNAAKDTRLDLVAEGRDPVRIDIPSVGMKEINKSLNMAFFDQVIGIPRGGSLEISLPEGADPVTIDCVQFAGAPASE